MTRYRFVLAILLLAFSVGCAGLRKQIHIMSDAEMLNKLGYHGEHRAVYRIGEDRCFTNDDTQPFPQADLRCY